MFRPYLELVRIPLTPTAVADSFAGYCLAKAIQGGAPSLSAMICVAGASVLSLWMGMASNDLFDAVRDRSRHPDRPIARGAVSPAAAAFFSALLALGAIGAAILVSPATALCTLCLILLAVIYNMGGKWIPLAGNLLMGSCRALNLLMGAAGALVPLNLVAAGETVALEEAAMAAAILGIYISCITSVSLLEDHPFQVKSYLWQTVPLLLLPVILAFLGGKGLLQILNCSMLFALLASAIIRAVGRPPQGGLLPGDGSPAPNPLPPFRANPLPNPAPAPGPHPPVLPAEMFVRTGLMGIFLVDAGFLLAKGLPHQAAVEYGLLILAWLWRRRWLQSSP